MLKMDCIEDCKVIDDLLEQSQLVIFVVINVPPKHMEDWHCKEDYKDPEKDETLSQLLLFEIEPLCRSIFLGDGSHN